MAGVRPVVCRLWHWCIAGFYIGFASGRQTTIRALCVTELDHAMQIGQVLALFNGTSGRVQNLGGRESRQTFQPQFLGEILIALTGKRAEKLIVVVQLEQRKGVIDGVYTGLKVDFLVSLPSCGR